MSSLAAPSYHSTDGSDSEGLSTDDDAVCSLSSECDSDEPPQYPDFEAFNLAIRNSNRILDALSCVNFPTTNDEVKSFENTRHEPQPSWSGSLTQCTKTSPVKSLVAQIKSTGEEVVTFESLSPPDHSQHGMCIAAIKEHGAGAHDTGSSNDSDTSHEAFFDHVISCSLINAAKERQEMASEWILHTTQTSAELVTLPLPVASTLVQDELPVSSPKVTTCSDIHVMHDHGCHEYTDDVKQKSVEESANEGAVTDEDAWEATAAAIIAAAAVKTVVERVAAAEREQLMQHAADAQHLLEQQLREQDAQATQRKLRHARRRIAVLQISHAWEMWHASAARAQRLAAIIKVQAFARVLMAKKRLASLKETAALQKLVKEGLAPGSTPTQQKAALGAAQAAGLDCDARRLVARLESTRAHLCAKLWAAARHAPMAQFSHARFQAMQIASLMKSDIEDAEATFQKRQRKIAEALHCEAASGNSQTFSAALSAALACGVDVAVIKQHQARWDQRCAALEATIQSIAAKAAFDPQAFDGAVSQAEALGLIDAVTAAKAHVQSRKARLTAKIHAANSAGDTSRLSALQEDAESLGLASALRALLDALHARARAAEGRLEIAARTADQHTFGTCLQDARAEGVQVSTMRSLTCVWSARGEAAGAELRSAAGAQPMADVLQLAQRAQALGQAAAAAHACSTMAGRARKCFAEVSRSVQKWMAMLGQTSATGACGTKGVPRRAHQPASRGCVVSALRKVSRFPCLSDIGKAAQPGPEHCLAWGAGCTSDACQACAVMETMRQPYAELESLGLQTAAATTAQWLHWCLGSLAAQHVRPVSVCDVPHDYFGTILPCEEREAPGSCSRPGSMDICMEAITTNEKLSPVTGKPVLQPVLGSEHVRLLDALNAFQKIRVTSPSSCLHCKSPECSSNDGHRSSLIGDTCSVQELTADMLQAFAGGEDITTCCMLHVSFSGLSSLHGMGTFCQHLAVLCVRANRLTSLHGLEPLGPSLRFLDVSENALTSLSSIEPLQELRFLNVGENSLTTLHGIQHLMKLQVLRAPNNSLAALGACIGRLSQLAELQVPGNCLSSLDSISGCIGLMHVGVARNIITSLQPLAHCNLLQEVCASENRVQSIDGVFCRHASLQRLQISTNRISALEPLPWLPQLESLDLADNPLPQLPPFTLQPALRTLNISFCSLPKHTIASALTPLTSLTDLQALDTLATENTHSDMSREEALTILPWLRDLDHVKVSAQQQASAALRALVSCPSAVQRVRHRLVSGDADLERISRLAVAIAGGVEAEEGEEALLTALPVVLRLAQPVTSVQSGSQSRCMTSPPSLSKPACALLKMRMHQHQEVLLSGKWECTQLWNELCTTAAGSSAQRLQELSDAHAQMQRACADVHAALQTTSPLPQGRMLQVNGAWMSRRAAVRQTAVVVLQRAWRACWARRCASHTMQHAAALRIQAWVRGCWTRQGGLLLELRARAAGQQRAAAVTLQRVWRGFRVRRLMAAARVAARESRRVAEGSTVSDQGEVDSLCGSLDWELPALGEELLQEADALDLSEALPAVTRRVRQVSSVADKTELPASHALVVDSAFGALPPLNSTHGVADGSVQLTDTQPVRQGQSTGGAMAEERIRQKLGPDSALIRKFELHQQRRCSVPLCRTFSNASTPATGSIPAHSNTAKVSGAATSECCGKALKPPCIAASQQGLVSSHPDRQVSPRLHRRLSTASPQSVHAHNSDAARERRLEKVQQLKAEWGFQDESTVAAFMQSQNHALRGRMKQKQRRRLEDPTARLQAFRKVAAAGRGGSKQTQPKVLAKQDMPEQGLNCHETLPPVPELRKQPATMATAAPPTTGVLLNNVQADLTSLCKGETGILSREGVVRASFLNQRAALDRCPAVLLHAWKKAHVSSVHRL